MTLEISTLVTLLFEKFPELKAAVDMYKSARRIEKAVAEMKVFKRWAVAVPFQRTRIISLPPGSRRRQSLWVEAVGLAVAGLLMIGLAVHLFLVTKPEAALENGSVFLVLYVVGTLVAMRGVGLTRVLRI